MSLDNIRLSYGEEEGYTSVKADYTFGTLDIVKSMNNRIKLDLRDLSELVDTLVELQSHDTRNKFNPIDVVSEVVKIQY